MANRYIKNILRGYDFFIRKRCYYFFNYHRLRTKYMHLWGLNERVQNNHDLVLSSILRIRNEDFWIELIIRTLAKLGEKNQIIVIDSGSDDQTLAIIQSLKDESIPLTLFRHFETGVALNLLVNLLLEKVARGAYFYLVDGDEIQLENSLWNILQHCSQYADGVVRYACQHCFFYPNNIAKITKLNCVNVRHMSGRVFAIDYVRLHKYAINDGIDFITKEYKNKFDNINDSITLHAALLQRSTIKTWKGHSTISPESNSKNHYLGKEEDYMTPWIFPKEVFELKYSKHNHYIKTIADMNNIKFE